MEDYEVLAAVYIEKGGARDLVPLRGQRAKSELWYLPAGPGWRPTSATPCATATPCSSGCCPSSAASTAGTCTGGGKYHDH